MGKKSSILLFVCLFSWISSFHTQAAADLANAENTENFAEKDEGGEHTVSGNTISEIVKLLLPESIELKIDPYEIKQCGQVYSDIYYIKNVSSISAKVLLNDIKCDVKAGNIVFYEGEDAARESSEKGIYLEMVMNDEEELAVTKSGKEYVLILEPEEEFSFYFRGAINDASLNDWNKGDLYFKMNVGWYPAEKEVLEIKGTVSGNVPN